MNTRWKGFARSWLLPFFDPRQLASLVYLPSFLADLREYRKLAANETVRIADAYPTRYDGKVLLRFPRLFIVASR